MFATLIYCGALAMWAIIPNKIINKHSHQMSIIKICVGWLHLILIDIFYIVVNEVVYECSLVIST